MGLRRDLTGAQARLSDTAGDVSEAQKQEMERNREILAARVAELTELRQQMAKLTKIIDSQKEEIKLLEGNLRLYFVALYDFVLLFDIDFPYQ